MKFETIRFQNKYQYKREIIHEILDTIEDTIPGLSPTRVNRYLEYLIDDQDFNIPNKCFYDKTTNKKLSVKFLSSIAIDYILEHINEFKYNRN